MTYPPFGKRPARFHGTTFARSSNRTANTGRPVARRARGANGAAPAGTPGRLPARGREKVEDTEGGFTLVELLVVIIIIGILAAIAIPVSLSQPHQGYDAAAESDARNLATLEETFLIGNGRYRTAPDAATVTSALRYQPSQNVSSVVIKTYTSASPRDAGAAGAEGNGSFCITTVSASPRTFIYDSALGGFTATACP